MLKDDEGVDRIFIKDWTFSALFQECFDPIWDYGKRDRYIQNAMKKMLEQLKDCNREEKLHALFDVYKDRVMKQIAQNDF